MNPMVEDRLKRALTLHQQQNLVEAEFLYRDVLNADPANFPALYLYGTLNFQLGRNIEALALLGKALGLAPNDAPTLLVFAAVLQSMGRTDEAFSVIGRTVAAHPDNRDAWMLHGNLLLALNRPAEALESYDVLLRLVPGDPFALNNRGNALRGLNRPQEALESYDGALAAAPDFPDAHNNRATVLRDLGRRDEAIAGYDKAVALQPGLAEIRCYRGRLLYELERFDDALADFDAALSIRPDYADAFDDRGTTLRRLGRLEEAAKAYARAVTYKRGDAALLANLGAVLMALRQPDKALDCFEAALAIEPRDSVILTNRGVVLQELGNFPAALTSFDKALAVDPDLPDTLNNRGFVLMYLAQPRAALASFDKALALDKDHAALSGAAMAALSACDWARADVLAQNLKQRIEGGQAVLPFVPMGYGLEPALQYRSEQLWAAQAVPEKSQPLWQGGKRQRDKIRVAYLSSDFHEHATAYLIAGLLEAHDRARFETLAISWGPDDGSPMRTRLKAGVDHFHDVRGKSDSQIAQMLQELQIDIAVDLKGYTQGCRPGILSRRPCPVQVNYLGFPGSMAADFIDYVIGDAVVTPSADQAFYLEKIVQLPGSYQVNDRARAAAEARPTRRAVGLPDAAFVFCCFNNNWKITAPVFAAWMRVLTAVPGSVLWLLGDSADAAESLKAAAKAQGVDPARLIFAARMPLKEHLARQGLADLFVDTQPYNAHTTASDTLWMGVPLVTCLGESFPGRVAASLLEAAGLPELVTKSLEEYEALILKLATDPAQMKAMREKLAAGRATCPLFDTPLFRKNIEAAYTRMLADAESGTIRAFTIS